MEILKEKASDILNLKAVEISEIPDIDLYMDQVTTFMETKLSSYKRNEEDKILTKTMINNYAKAKLFPSPYKKKYNKNHIMLLIIIYHLKSILSISDIKTLLEPVNAELEENENSKILESVYLNFVRLQKNISLSYLNGEEKKTSFESIIEIPFSQEKREVIKNILFVLMLAIHSETEKRLAEKILDEEFNF